MDILNISRVHVADSLSKHLFPSYISLVSMLVLDSLMGCWWLVGRPALPMGKWVCASAVQVQVWGWLVPGESLHVLHLYVFWWCVCLVVGNGVCVAGGPSGQGIHTQAKRVVQGLPVTGVPLLKSPGHARLCCTEGGMWLQWGQCRYQGHSLRLNSVKSTTWKIFILIYWTDNVLFVGWLKMRNQWWEVHVICTCTCILEGPE